MSINTRLAQRRTLVFGSLDDVRAEATRIVASAHAGTLTTTGNWTPAQALNHCAGWIEYAFNGYPNRPPWFVKLIVRLARHRFLSSQIPVGVRIPGVEGGTYSTEDGPIDLAMARFERALARLEREAPTLPNPIFGQMTHDEWKRMHISHAALHFSFLWP